MPKLVVKGMDKILKSLDAYPKDAKKVIRKALRKAIKPVKEAVKADAPVDSGTLKAAVKIKSAKRKKGRIAIVVQIGEGDFKGHTFYGSFVIYGYHKDGKAYPPNMFMAEAFEATADQCRDSLVDEILAGLDKLGSS